MHLLSKVNDVSVQVGAETISAAQCAKNIGATIDATMEMKQQVNQIVRSCYFQLRNISKIRKYLTQDATAQLIHSFVTSRLDSLNSLLYGVPDYLIDKLQLIQNNAARVVFRLPPSDHITEALRHLHWLPVRYRIWFKVLLLAYKAQNNAAPVYLSDLLSPYIPSRSLRSEQQCRLEQPASHSRKYGDRAFSVCAPRLWNELPNEIKMAKTVDSFKSLLKTHLFKIAYDV
jgi:hypothetical protein